MKKRSLKPLLIISILMISCFCLAACGNNQDGYLADEVPGTEQELGSTAREADTNQGQEATDTESQTEHDQQPTDENHSILDDAENMMDDIKDK